MIKILAACPLVLLFAAVAPAHAQADPQAAVPQAVNPNNTGFQIPTINGSLNYSLTASESITFNYNDTGETASSLSMSGNLGYLAPSLVHPLAITYSGGYLLTTSGRSQPSTYFQNASVSQTINGKSYTLVLSDSFRYLPDSPSVGLSGIPGLGDIGVVTTAPTSQGILTPYATQIQNSLSVSGSLRLTGRTSLQSSFGLGQLHFVSEPGALDSNTYQGSVSINHHFDARTAGSVSVIYLYTDYSGSAGSYAGEEVTASFSRQLSRKLSLSASAGPERITQNTTPPSQPILGYTVGAQLSYSVADVHGSTFSLAFGRGDSNGSGVTQGVIANTYSLLANRGLTRRMRGSAQFGYTSSTGLETFNTQQQQLNTQTLIASGQVSYGFSQALSAYGSYSAQRQIASGQVLGLTPFNGLGQTLGFGLTYSPRSIHVGRK